MNNRAKVWMAGITALAAASQGVNSQSLPNGVASGDGDQTMVVLWAHSTALGPITFEYAASADFSDGVMLEAVADDSTIPVKVDVNGLTAGTQYYYRVTTSAGDSERGSFRTPFESGFHGLRFGASGDWRGELAPYPSISNLAAADLDFFAALGDTIYADVPSVDFPDDQARSVGDYRIKHNEVYSERFGENYWAEARASSALLAIVDDHEVTNDFAGGAPPATDGRFDRSGVFINETELFENGLRTFHEYNPIREEFYGDTSDARTANKRKLYRYRRFGSDAAVFLLDARSFRDEELPNLINPFANRDLRVFVNDAFDPARTMLGEVQIEEFLHDLVDAQIRGVTWKFIMVPEPIQNLSPVLAGDRFEGYAFERTLILDSINTLGITNVVFVSADIHSTFVNNLTYQKFAGDVQHATDAFEITTGAVAYAAPFGPTVLDYVPFAPLRRLIGGFYDRLPTSRQDRFFLRSANWLLRRFGYSPVGLGGTSIDAELTEGRYLAVNSYGWTQFDVDAASQRLTVTTYGIPWYDRQDLEEDPEAILARVPEVVSQFHVEPAIAPRRPFDQQVRPPSPCGALGMVGLVWPVGYLFFGLMRTRWDSRSR